MRKHYETKSGSDAGEQSSSSDSLRAIDALYTLEMKANLAALRQQRRRTRLQKSLKQWSEYWPVAIGIVLSICAPELRDIVATMQPWAMWIVFPLVVLAGRPEVNMGDVMAVYLPMAMLYIQFPLEGLLARLLLKGDVTVRGVAVQVLFFHALCIIELWLVNGGLWQLLKR
jgi:hypothetical protein